MKTDDFDDSTVLDMGVEKKTAKDDDVTETKEKKKGEWKKVALGTGAGIVLGAGATVLTSSALLDENDEPELSDEEQTEGYTPLFDEAITMASGINDDMSFADAFDAAREEVGPGGVFVWHGNVYSTYTPEEWDNMSEEDIADYSDHFSWSPEAAEEVLVEELPGDVAEAPEVIYTAQTSVVNDGGIPVASGVSDDMSFSQAFAEARAEVGPGGAFVWHGTVYNTYRDTEWNTMSQSERLEFSNQAIAAAHHQDGGEHYAQNTGGVYADPMVVETVNDSAVEVEVLGVEHDYDTGMNIGAVAIDGEEVILADVTGDGAFNLAWVDENGDGLIQDNEVQDISDAGLTVNDLLDNPMDNPVYYAANMETNGEPDFVNDADVSGYMA